MKALMLVIQRMIVFRTPMSTRETLKLAMIAGVASDMMVV